MVTMIMNGFLKKECSRLRIVQCGDETPTAMRDITHLCKVSGRFVPLELKVGFLFLVGVPRPPS